LAKIIFKVQVVKICLYMYINRTWLRNHKDTKPVVPTCEIIIWWYP